MPQTQLVNQQELIQVKVLEMKLKTFKQIEPSYLTFRNWEEWEELGQVLGVPIEGRTEDWVVIRNRNTNQLLRIPRTQYVAQVMDRDRVEVREGRREKTRSQREILSSLPQFFAV